MIERLIRLTLAVLLGGALAFAAPAAAAGKRIALSFDDVPRREGAHITPDAQTRPPIATRRNEEAFLSDTFGCGSIQPGVYPYGYPGRSQVR